MRREDTNEIRQFVDLIRGSLELASGLERPLSVVKHSRLLTEPTYRTVDIHATLEAPSALAE